MKNKRKTVLSLGVLISSIFTPLQLFAQENAKSAQVDKPNVIIIITDDQGYGDLACHVTQSLRRHSSINSTQNLSASLIFTSVPSAHPLDQL